MDQTALADAPYFDPATLRSQIETLIKKSGGFDDAYGDLLALLKALVKDTRATARARLERDGDGRACAAGLSSFQDELIKVLFDITLAHHIDDKDAGEAQAISIVATGGYGRGLLAPGSDIDLLFLLPSRHGPVGEQVAERILYVLWDLGFKVGHATRTIQQSVQLALADITIRTSLLDSRLVRGDRDLFDKLMQRFADDVMRPTSRDFIDAKMTERDERHQRSGDARYRVEPNIKDGKGGLRDLHTLHWLSKAIYGEEVGNATVEAGIFTEEEAALFRRCEDFLWTIRCFLHFLTGRAEERITFDVQPQMAEWLGYRKHGGLRGVERFMKHYFLVAKDVGDLTGILCSALEIQQLKSSPSGVSKLFSPLSWKTRREVRTRTEFRIENGRITIADSGVFERDPVNILRLFAQSASTDTYLHPDAIRQLRHSLRLIDKSVRNDPVANEIFLDLLTSKNRPAVVLRRMNDAGVLGRFILAFRRVVGMMQFNMYHHYTVDEHLIRTVDMLSDIEEGVSIDELPLSTRLINTIQNRKALFVAAFLHDIGKGRKEDHSTVGARIARELCPRLGLSAAETDTVCWLIQEHLTMSNIAQSRDISDPKTIRDFAAIVKSPERLKLLLLLTAADIRAVGPGTWNGWKGQLLRTLYHETEVVVSGGYSQEGRASRVAKAQNALADALAKEGWSEDEIAKTGDRFFDDYWLRFDTETQVEHAKLIVKTLTAQEKLEVTHKSDAFTAITELTIFAPNHARLLSLFAGACAITGANIMGAQISSTRDGFAIDTFMLQREFDNDEDEERRAHRIRQLIVRLLKGEGRVKALLEKRRPSEHRVEAFSVEPEVTINDALSDQFTVIEVAGRDRPGLLYDLTAALSNLSLDISSAHITTFGEKAIDVFYVTDLMGKKVSSNDKRAAVRRKLEEILLIGNPDTPELV